MQSQSDLCGKMEEIASLEKQLQELKQLYNARALKSQQVPEIPKRKFDILQIRTHLECSDMEILEMACTKGDGPLVMQILEGYTMNGIKDKGFRDSSEPLVLFALRNGADINFECLRLASQQNMGKVFAEVMKHTNKFDINEKIQGETLLEWTCWRSQTEMAMMLINAGAASSSGAREYARKRNLVEVLKKLAPQEVIQPSQTEEEKHKNLLEQLKKAYVDDDVQLQNMFMEKLDQFEKAERQLKGAIEEINNTEQQLKSAIEEKKKEQNPAEQQLMLTKEEKRKELGAIEEQLKMVTEKNQKEIDATTQHILAIKTEQIKQYAIIEKQLADEKRKIFGL